MKKVVAVVLCVVLVLVIGFTAFAGNFYEKAAVIDGTEISSGLYLMAQFTAYNEARYLVEDSEKDVLKQKIEGQSATNWIRQRTEELCRKYVCVMRLSREKDLSLSYEGQQNVEQMMQYWPYMEEIYTENGISESTLRRYATNEQLAADLFAVLYGEGGELEVPDAELKKEYGEQYAHLRYIMIPLTSSVEGVDVKEEVLAEADNMVQALQDGGSLEEVAEEYLPGIYQTLTKELDPETIVEKIGATYIEYATEDTETYSPEFLEELRAQQVGDVGAYQVNDNVLVYVKIDTFADEAEFEEMRSSVLSTLRNDEYEEYLSAIYNEYAIEWMLGAKTYFSPKKIVGY